MRKLFRISLAILLVALIVGPIWWIFSAHEPVYQGKTLTAWLESLNDPPGKGPNQGPNSWMYGGWNAGWSQEKGEQVRQALQAAGPRAIPVLRRMIRYRDTPRRLKWQNLALKQNLIQFHFKTEMEIHMEAKAACELADESVRTPLVSDWIKYLQDRDWEGGRITGGDAVTAVELNNTARLCCMASFWNVGPAAFEPLRQALKDPHAYIRYLAAFQLAQFKSKSDVLVPALLEMVRSDPDDMARAGAISSLRQMPDDAAPALIRNLNDPSPALRARVSSILCSYTNEAQLIVPAIRQAMTDPDFVGRTEASNILKSFPPDELRKYQ